MNLRHSTPDWSVWRNNVDPDRLYRGLKEIGFAAVEMSNETRWADIRAAGLDVLNMGAHGIEKGLNRVEHHAELIPRVADRIASASAAGIPHVIVFSGNSDGQADAEGLANCVTALRQLAPLAEKAGVTLTFEMLNQANHADYQGCRSAYGFELVQRVGSPAVKVLYDIYHMHRSGEDTLADLLGNLDAVAHIHIAASPKRDLPTADGEIDYAKIVPSVMEAGYAGLWGHEFMPGDDPLAELAKSVELFESFAA